MEVSNLKTAGAGARRFPDANRMRLGSHFPVGFQSSSATSLIVHSYSLCCMEIRPKSCVYKSRHFSRYGSWSAFTCKEVLKNTNAEDISSTAESSAKVKDSAQQARHTTSGGRV
jgi:hypothetical protein